MGLIFIIVSVPVYFFYFEIGIIITIIGLLTLIIQRHKDFTRKIKLQRAQKIYKEIRYSFPVSEETFSLSKICDISSTLNSHKTWLINAIDALEKEYRISKNKMFLYNRNKTAAKPPYITINIENMNYKKGEDYHKVFYKSNNYRDICRFLNRRTIPNLEEKLKNFTKLIEKKENPR